VRLCDDRFDQSLHARIALVEQVREQI